jgi:hypothetical protein
MTLNTKMSVSTSGLTVSCIFHLLLFSILKIAGTSSRDYFTGNKVESC